MSVGTAPARGYEGHSAPRHPCFTSRNGTAKGEDRSRLRDPAPTVWNPQTREITQTEDKCATSPKGEPAQTVNRFGSLQL